MGNQHITSGTVITDTNSSALVESGGGTIIVDAGAFLFALAPGPGDAIELNGGPYTVTINGEAYSETDDGIDLVTLGSFKSTITVGKNGNVFGVSNGIEAGHLANITNSGTIKGEASGIVESGSGNFKISNIATGVIHGEDRGLFIVGFGTHNIANAGLIRGENDFGIQASFGVENVTNWGEILGDVSLGGGDDVFTNFKKFGTVIKNGTINNTIDLGDGNDRFFGSAHREEVSDNDGSDHVKLGGGADVYTATGATGSDGKDSIDGGGGVDAYDALSATNVVIINLGTVAHQNFAATTAYGLEVTGSLIVGEAIKSFEYAFVGAGNDVIYGSKSANVLGGGGGADTLFGYGGNDNLDGGSGSDVLIGGIGRDTLIGGSDSDTFRYSALSDSTIAKSGRDLIGFEDGVDKIDLSDIDAVAAGSDDAFSFVGVNVAFSGTPGDLRVIATSTGFLIQGDVNGDKKSDFAIEVQDLNHTINWGANDFDL